MANHSDGPLSFEFYWRKQIEHLLHTFDIDIEYFIFYHSSFLINKRSIIFIHVADGDLIKALCEFVFSEKKYFF